MSADRELLELAAKAAGIAYDGWVEVPMNYGTNDTGLNVDGYRDLWNPLEDDGQALRLAVKLGAQVSIDLAKNCASALLDDGETVPCEWFGKGQQTAEAATRRAIVRAAAEIGACHG
ncbi:hypothetical protein [Aquabacterium sp.]|uniref:hypothetical protein n=1 Tax=Aquabacterium sp. TaxID=1872578 RepID=UPI0025B98498|nr:hypothetical protein [Aquabacterium sp.]